MNRLHWIDNLRVLVIILVVVLHAAVTYSGIGGWYYKENRPLDTASIALFAFYQTFMQAWFMSLLFMVSGYFSAASLSRDRAGRFVAGRFRRLGIPLVIYIFLLHPLSVKLAYPDVELLGWYWRGIKRLAFFSWTGPLWFVEALLIFTLCHVYIFRPLLRSAAPLRLNLTAANVLILVLLITLVAFTTRLYFPIGSDVTNLQFSFFSGYMFMFAVGVIAYGDKTFDRITLRDGRRWLFLSLGLGVPAWILIMVFGGPRDGVMLIEGGLNWPAFSYALWESFTCVTFIVAMVGIFKFKVNVRGRLQQFLSDNAFGVFVFHAPVLIAVSMLLKRLEWHPLLKFLLASVLAVLASLTVSWLVRRVEIFRKAFS